MSVDTTAKIIYGYVMTNKEFEEKWSKYWLNKEEEPWDNCIQINCYDIDSDIIFGFSLDSTSDYEFLDATLFEVAKRDKDYLTAQWGEAMPERAKEEPKFILVSHWW